MMSDNERRESDEFGPDTALTRALLRLGPLLRRRERTDAEEPDPTFLAALEARLTTLDVAAPRPPMGAGARREHDARPRVVAPVPRRRPPLVAWGGLAAAALLAALAVVAVVVVVRTPGRTPASPTLIAFAVPAPRLADLTRGYPQALGGGGIVTPMVSLIDLAPGVPYAGHLRLSIPPLPNGPTTLHAYRLAPPSFALARISALAARLGIGAPVTPARAGNATWSVVSTGGLPSSRPLHSVAVATATGELIYHDTSYAPPARPPQALDAARAASAAHAWLTRVGWPAARMPLQSVGTVSAEPPGVRAVNLGWADADPAATSAATLWVTPEGQIIEARLWPPVERSRTIRARGIGTASDNMRRGHSPVAVTGVPPLTTAAGAGTTRRVTVAQVLTAGTDRRLYLVPAYQFAGTVQLHGFPDSHAWYGLVPAARR